MERWPPAADFPVDGSAEMRTAAADKLQAAWKEQVSSLNAASRRPSLRAGRHGPTQCAGRDDECRPDRGHRGGCAAGRSSGRTQTSPAPRRTESTGKLQRPAAPTKSSPCALGQGILPALEQLIADESVRVPPEMYTAVLPHTNPEFAAIEDLRSDDLTRRWQGAEKLEALAARKPLPNLVVERLAAVMSSQREPQVWQPVLTAMIRDGREPAERIAYMALSQTSPEVAPPSLRASGAALVAQPCAGAAPLAERPADRGPDRRGRRARRGRQIGRSRPLAALLTRPDKTVRLEAATALTQLGATEGRAALERLAADPDADIRRAAATAMGETAEPTFVPTLIALLVDRHDIVRGAR